MGQLFQRTVGDCSIVRRHRDAGDKMLRFLYFDGVFEFSKSGLRQ